MLTFRPAQVNNAKYRKTKFKIDLKIKLPSEDWYLKPGSIGRAARFVNHPDNLPDVDFRPAQVNNAKYRKTKFKINLVYGIITLVTWLVDWLPGW